MKKILVLVTILFAIFLVLGCENSTGGTNPNVNEDPSGGTNPIGEWWVFEKGWYLTPSNAVDLYAYYEGNTFIKGGTQTEQIPNDQLLLYQNKNQATSNFIGTFYQVTDLSKIPYWAY